MKTLFEFISNFFDYKRFKLDIFFARHPVEILNLVKIASRYNWESNNVTFLGIKISQNSNVFPFKSKCLYKCNYRVAFYMSTCMDAP